MWTPYHPKDPNLQTPYTYIITKIKLKQFNNKILTLKKTIKANLLFKVSYPFTNINSITPLFKIKYSSPTNIFSFINHQHFPSQSPFTMKPISMATLFLFTLFTITSAMDMSIISYDNTHTNYRTDTEINSLFESWLVKHGKTYNALGEKDRRFQIFKDNVNFIDNHNSGDHTYKLGLNKFADLTNEEYRITYTGIKRIDEKKKIMKVKSDRYAFRSGDDSLPESVDWRDQGAVTGVKDQGSCGMFFCFLNIGSKFNCMSYKLLYQPFV